jgi:cell pole-organizing protein PopZ
MSDFKEQEELSVEEILVSIRKIISEDKEEPLADKDESAVEGVVEVVTDASYFLKSEKKGDAEKGVLELTQMVSEDGTVVDLTKTAEEEAPPFKDILEPKEPLVSDPVAATSTEAFTNLAAALVQGKIIEGRTVEELIKEILRPLLKQWLNDNLSELVEHLVKNEIKELSGRARIL